MAQYSTNRWNAELYDTKMGFVSELGKGVLDFLAVQAGESVLDLGCGTGDLTAAIADAGALPVGIDLSDEMIRQARDKYPSLCFAVANAETYRTEQSFDAVFSNAALHWMKRPADVIDSIWLALRPGGRFVAEFGGKGNVQTIVAGITEVLADYGIDAWQRHPWYFPSIAEYSTLLEQRGFTVAYACLFERPTPLGTESDAIADWLDSFADPFFYDFSAKEKAAAYRKIADKLRPKLYMERNWVGDYRRLRVVAYKERDNGQSRN
ncbi:class I SAM-dependent methyltransferase [Brevibacillus humidisoli]|uniref:class I SAM-dependent methyltransferase n=1 Tax=Brevibacillus humidisoli TaxID=2895522 RepID=UPI001E5D3F43|nr:class I SAM-dependent methyltransferase [Brevibacillus humidisoli]UFJ41269.1 class I SAM-dependent methyltransferase [Brevibacillus humidisoli]